MRRRRRRDLSSSSSPRLRSTPISSIRDARLSSKRNRTASLSQPSPSPSPLAPVRIDEPRTIVHCTVGSAATKVSELRRDVSRFCLAGSVLACALPPCPLYAVESGRPRGRGRSCPALPLPPAVLVLEHGVPTYPRGRHSSRSLPSSRPSRQSCPGPLLLARITHQTAKPNPPPANTCSSALLLARASFPSSPRPLSHPILSAQFFLGFSSQSSPALTRCCIRVPSPVTLARRSCNRGRDVRASDNR